jgi:hypothetical protein
MVAGRQAWLIEFLSDQKLAAHCAANGLRYAREHFSFDRMIQTKFQVDASLSRTRKARPLPSSNAATPALASASTVQPVSRD